MQTLPISYPTEILAKYLLWSLFEKHLSTLGALNSFDFYQSKFIFLGLFIPIAFFLWLWWRFNSSFEISTKQINLILCPFRFSIHSWQSHL